ncbi:OmpA family protein [Brumimicrobium aurantiacum]|uniref:OmpA family protein n=1 Tax=Brumimicrobium aurantiacum TaxID=1737063 RepID=A0A3E1EXL8_9FLAO|nr:OmpA family protein [Brumimicrobium aurantiacum]RFC54299.1 OmpA family protein [Brumimicrobium aurantiacum]
MAKNYSLIIFLLFSVSFVFSQVEDEACLPPGKKVKKLIEKAKKEAPPEASKLFREAISEEPDNATAYYEFAMYAYNNGLDLYNSDPDPKRGDSYMKVAEGLFNKTIDRCSNFHANCYYYLGVINYTFQNEKEAVKYFQKFNDFDHDDMDRFSDDREKRLNDVAEVLSKFKEEQSFYDNAVPFSPSKVENVSTLRDEYFPMISPDNELIFYTRRVDRTAKGDIISTINEEFTWSKRKNKNTPFDGGNPLASPFNNGVFDSYGAATLSVDNKEMIICACKDENVRGQNYRNCDLYRTYYERTGEGGNDYVWTELENLGDGINTNDGWEGQPTMSADGNTLYFSAIRPTTQNDDIFYSKRLSDGSWGPSQPFAEVNTAGKDKSPFFHQDSETFYFVSSVSEQRKGLGGTDIFYMRKQEDGSWSKPKNIGYPINSEEDEIGLFVSIDGEDAYFSSRQGGIWDIYSFELYEEARPKAVTIVKGNLNTEDNSPVEDVQVEIAYSNSDKVEKVRVNGNDGKYAAVVKVEDNEDVMVNVKKKGHAFDSQIITKEELAKGETIESKDMMVREIEVGEPYTINDILYNTASDELSERAKFILKQFARFLKENEEYNILIQGHTDNEGIAEKNLKLSEKRANGVKDFLIENGIDKQRLSAKGYGQTQPKVPNTSESNKRKNRRTDFVIQKK